MANVLGNLEPKIVWEIFEEITKYPRPSKKEEKIIAYIEKFAQDLNLEYKKDKLGNLVIKKPATAGMENRKGFCIQAHVDMVCEKNRDVNFDFDNDSIQTWIDGDWVKAKGTTLGADNGIGLAMGMAVLADKNLSHPDYELLCTLDEETGLTGALQLGTDLLEHKILINLDSEEDGHFTIGCAGGINTKATFNYVATNIAEGSVSYELGIKGLRGGHSGIEINDGRANSNKLLARILGDLSSKYSFQLSSIEGGNKHNAIPREAFSVISFSNSLVNEVTSFIKNIESDLKAEYATKEPDLQIVFESIAAPSRAMTLELQNSILRSFRAMPHGVIRMNPDIDGLVQTSTNFAVVTTDEQGVHILTSQRSLRESEKFDLAAMVGDVLRLGGANVDATDGYPAWQPNINSPILEIAKSKFKEMYGHEPIIETIHAGLECGLVGEKYPGMDMLSFGPTLKEVHTPNEKVQISTVEKCWNLLVSIISAIPTK